MESKPVPMKPMRKEHGGGVSSEWTERLGGLAGGADVADAGRIQGRRRGKDDEVGHQVGQDHAGVDVQLRTPKLGLGGVQLVVLVQLLDLFGCLPEEEVGRYRGAEESDERGHEFSRQADVWQERAA